jgi:amino acid adenylation domain-containing protein/non-ribosomal peptide synthase protein (TIGR01720 family)
MTKDISELIEGLSSEKRALLELRLKNNGSNRNSFPLSFAQERLWSIEQLDFDKSLYNTPFALLLKGPLNVSALEKALTEVTRRHEILRTVFQTINGEPRQVINPPVAQLLHITDFQTLPPEERMPAVRRVVAEEGRIPFDLSEGPLTRTRLLRLSSDEHVVVRTEHHMITDASSQEIFMGEVTALYTGYTNGNHFKLPEPSLQYADYAVWQRKWLQGEVLEKQIDYWKSKLGGNLPVLNLPADRPRPAIQSFKGAIEFAVLSSQLNTDLAALSRREGVSYFILLLAAFQTLLHRYTGENDITVGTPILNRSRVELESVLGFFGNTLALRTDLSGNPGFLELLKRVREVALGAYANQDVPFDKIVRAVQPERSLSHTAVFQAMFTLHNDSEGSQKIGELAWRPINVDTGMARFDLNLTMEPSPGGLGITLQYATDLFNAETIRRMLVHFENLLEGIACAPELPISEFPLLPESEKQQILVQWNHTRRDYPLNKPLHEFFEEQVTRTPDAPALTFAQQHLTYAELNARANQLARHLRHLGVKPESCVGILMERSIEMVISLWAVLKAGGAYVPLDPAYPRERLSFMLEDSAVPILLTQQHLQEQLPAHHATVLCVDSSWPEIARQSVENLESVTTPCNLAYVIYTSGSTGRPKGAMISHRGIANRLIWMQEAYQLTASETVLQKTPFSFDVSVWEFFWPMMVGARLVLAVPGGHQDSAYLVRLIREEEVTTLHFVPSMMQVFLETHGVERCTSLRRVICSGEALSNELRQRFFARLKAQLHNLYGPTEASVDVTFRECQPDEMRTSVPIGRPIANTQIYILDEHLQPVPTGVAGELYIGGVGLGHGYLRRPELTAEKFVPHPFSTRPGERLYRTGDQARHLHDGEIEFLGRLDQQVKLRGFRIELGEIEAALAQHPSVSEVAVVLREDAPGDKRLVAYLVIRQGEVAPNNSELRDFLQSKLPDHMVPAAFMFMDALPLSPSGKLDRRALPSPAGTRPELQSSFVAPRTHAEQVLAAIWADVLRVEHVGIHDDFFDLGGDSILSIQVVSRANQEGLRLRPRQIFQHHTIAQLAAVAETAPQLETEQETITGPVSLTPIQRWFFEQDFADPHHFNQAVMLKVEERLDASLLEEIVTELIQQHDALRLRFIRNGEDWQQIDEAAEMTADVFVQFDLRHLAAEEQRQAIEEKAAELQRSLDLTQGPLIKIALLELGDETSRLLIVIHHLAVDGVSWRVLLEDLEKAYRQRSIGEPINLGPKTTSFKEWSQRLQQYQKSTAEEPEFDYWHTDARRNIKPLPTEITGGLNTVEHEHGISNSLSVEDTHALLYEVGAAYHTQINDALLTALLRTLSQWTGERRVLIDLEGHGREDIAEDVDVSRTVGWFTTIFPVLLQQDGPWHPGETLKLVKEQLRAIPRRGIGYGLIRYLSEDESIKQQFRELPRAEVIFNYLGQLDGMLSAAGGFSLAPESMGAMRSPRAKRTHLLDISASIIGERLQVVWSYSREVFHQQTIERLAAGFNEALGEIITHCVSAEPGWTPSDFPLARLSDAQLQRVLRGRRDVEDIYALSPIQEGMLFQSLYEAGTGVYLTQVTCELKGELDIPAFEQSWSEIINRHPSLRTAFEWDGLDSPVQIVNRSVEVRLEQVDWRGHEPAVQQNLLAEYLQSMRKSGFQLNQVPLIKITLFKTGDNVYRFAWNCHHLLIDGWSVPIIITEVLTVYDALTHGKQPALGEVQSYRNFIEWVSRQDASSAENYWRTTFAGQNSPTPILNGTNSDDVPIGDFGEQKIYLTLEETAQLNSAARRLHITMNTLVQGAWALLLSRFSNREKVIYGVTSSGRPASLPGVEKIVGNFINTLPTCVHVRRDARVGDWLTDLQAQQSEQRQFEYSTLSQVHGFTDIPRSMRLFDSILVFENYPSYESEGGPGRELGIRDVHTFGRTNYPLTVTVKGTARLLLMVWHDYNQAGDETTSRIINYFRQILLNLAADTDQRLDEVELNSVADLHQLLVEWNQTQTPYPSESCIQELFEIQAAQRAGEVALVGDEESLTYAKLNRRANRLAHYLRSLGVGPEVRVGVCLERSVEAIVALLGIVKAGGVYVPLEPSYPLERLSFLAEDSQVSVIVTEEVFLDALPAMLGQIVSMDADAEVIESQSDDDLQTETSALNLAYIMYTSGSTGTPKGVGVTHRGVVRLVRETNFAEMAGEVMLQFAPLSFDASTFEIWGSLLNGGKLVLAGRGKQTLAELGEVITGQGVTTMWLTAGLFHQVIEEGAAGLSGVRQLLAGGDALSARHLRLAFEQLPETRLINGYGPTETTTFACTEALSETSVVDERVSIGRPIANTKVYILDEGFRATPVGVRGEIYIGGDGLARGYVGRADLTAERFVPDPYSTAGGERLYATGDIASWRADGRIEFVGRRDGQVKVRGFRIELAEIETVLRAHSAVEECVVLVKQSEGDEKSLVAYYANEDGELSAATLREYMKARVPDYMVPSQFVNVTKMPLTANGKIDREALFALGAVEREDQPSFSLPKTPTEELLASIWARALQLERVGRDDDFFELGGHSLLATRIISRVRETLSVELPLSVLFENPTPALMANEVEAAVRRSAGSSQPASIEPVSRDQQLPLSFAQQRLWFLNELEPGSAFYNIPVVLRLSGPLNVPVLEQTLTEVIRRHELLRTTFVTSADGTPYQQINAAVPFKLPIEDLSGLAPADRQAEAQRLALAEAQKPFDLAWGPLLRVSLLRLAEEDHVAMVTLHHIVSDAWSTDVFVREVATLYDTYSKGNESPLEELPVQYGDFAVWQRDWLSGQVLEEQLGYWRDHLGGELAVLNLPTDRPRPPVQSYRGAHQTLMLSAELRARVKELCRSEGVTFYMALLAAFQVLLHRYTRQNDIVVGTPIAGRNRAETEGLIGFFVNTLVMRTDLSGEPSFKEVLRRVREISLGAYAHQDLPFEKLVEELQPERDLSRHPLFQVMFETPNPPNELMQLSKLHMESINVDDATAKFDLTVLVAEHEDGMSVRLEYCIDLFEAETITRLGRHFENLLTGLVADPSRAVGDVQLLTEGEREQLLGEWNETAQQFPHELCFHQLFTAQAKRSPEATAASCAGCNWTYRELDQRTNQLARCLQENGLRAEQRVGVYMERGLELLESMIAIFKAGGVYVPLDPLYPKDRLAFLLSDARVSVLLTREAFLENLPEHDLPLICVDRDWDKNIANQSPDALADLTLPDNLAYVIYTSGSTGKPKGAMIEHRGMVNHLFAKIHDLDLAARDVMAQTASQTFDISVWQMLVPLLRGGRVEIFADEVAHHPLRLFAAATKEQVTILEVVPSLLRGLLEEPDAAEACESSRLRWLIVTGEALPPGLCRQWLELRPDVPLLNAYGPTECSDDVAHFTIREPLPVEATSTPIGRPVSNMRLYVADEVLRLLPAGVVGELYAAGTGVGRGYLNQPDLTAEKFLPDPFSSEPGARIYRTGDLARFNSDGNIEFLGRLDHQVKVHGFRIELGEIETALRQYEGVSEAVVMVNGGSLRAYLVAGVQIAVDDLRNYLKILLPEYMIPNGFVMLETLPLTSNGKIDRRALAQLETAETARVYVPPRTAVEEVVAAIWAEVLKLERIGIHDSFFDLGGHSLLSIQVLTRLQKTFHVDLPLRALFEYDTVAGISQRIVAMEARPGQMEKIAEIVKRIGSMSDADKQRLLQQKRDREVMHVES